MNESSLRPSIFIHKQHLNNPEVILILIFKSIELLSHNTHNMWTWYCLIISTLSESNKIFPFFIVLQFGSSWFITLLDMLTKNFLFIWAIRFSYLYSIPPGCRSPVLFLSPFTNTPFILPANSEWNSKFVQFDQWNKSKIFKTLAF